MSKHQDDHSRGEGHPSSLESYHHIDQSGHVVYSRAQKEAIAATKARKDETRPPVAATFVDYEFPHTPNKVVPEPEPEAAEEGADVVIEEDAETDADQEEPEVYEEDEDDA